MKATNAAQALAEALATVEAAYRKHFPEHVDAIKAALAVVAVEALAESSPTALFFVGDSGAGKTEILRPFVAIEPPDPLAAHFYRCDDLTPQAFVSHRADLSDEELKKIDLLPKIEDKTMISKELGPMFRGRREALRDNFKKLTAVLDGDGYTSDSGAHGRRGYPRPINFRWLAGTTPLSNEAVEEMGALGPRLLLYSTDRQRKSVEELAVLARRTKPIVAREACRRAVHAFLSAFFVQHARGSVSLDDTELGERELRRLALWVRVLTALRAVRSGDDTVQEEYPERALYTLRDLARGHALIHGRARLTDEDIALVAHIAMSSGPRMRQRTFRALLELGGSATTPDLENRLGVSQPTASAYMKDLAGVGLAVFRKGSPDVIELAADYAELLGASAQSEKEGEGTGARANEEVVEISDG